MPLAGVLTANTLIANHFILQVKNTCKGKILFFLKNLKK